MSLVKKKLNGIEASVEKDLWSLSELEFVKVVISSRLLCINQNCTDKKIDLLANQYFD